MLRIVSTQKEGVSFALLCEKTYTVGRKQGDIRFPDDQSVSRLHAELVAEHPVGNLSEPILTPVLSVTDVGSKFGTFATEAVIISKTPIHPREMVTLPIGEKLRFGLQWNEFRIDYTPLVVTTSSTKAKSELKDNVAKLGGHVVGDWSGNVTHVVMDSVTLTIKAVCALLAGKCIVTAAFLADLVSSFETNKRQPNPRDYLPPVSEREFTSVNSSAFHPNSARSVLFAGKIFLFCTQKHLAKMAPAIEAGGGTAKLLLKAVAENIASDNYILMGHPLDISMGEKDSRTKAVIERYKQSGKRIIGDSEIGLAAVYNNIEKHCNPKCNIKEAVLPHITSQTQDQSNTTSLVPPTQDLDIDTQRSDTSRNVVDETFDRDEESEKTSSQGTSKRPTTELSEGSSAKKRSAVESLSGPQLKRLKENSITSTRSPTKSDAGNSSRALTNLFNLSDSDSEEDVVPETQPQLTEADEDVVPESPPALVNIVDVRDLQSTAGSQESEIMEEEVFRVPSSPPQSEPTLRRSRRGTENLLTVTESIMNAPTIRVSSVVETSVPVETPPSGSKSRDLGTPKRREEAEVANVGSSKKRRRETDEDTLAEKTKKINLTELKIKKEENEEETSSALQPVFVTKPLVNVNRNRRRSGIQSSGSSIAESGNQKNFKAFRKVLPSFVDAGENPNDSENMNVTIESIRSSGKPFTLVSYDYAPGTGSTYIDRPHPVAPPLRNEESATPPPDLPSSNSGEFTFAPTRSTASIRRDNRKEPTPTPAPPPAETRSSRRRTSPRKKAGNAPASRSRGPQAAGQEIIEVDEEEQGGDMWSFGSR